MRRSFTLFLLLSMIPMGLFAQQKRALTLEDIMQFNQLRDPMISDDGDWVALTARPDRGDPTVHIYSTSGKEHFVVDRAEKPVIASDGRFAAMTAVVPAEVQERFADDKKKMPKKGMVLFDLKAGTERRIDSVDQFRFSNDGEFLVLKRIEKEVKKRGSKTKFGTTVTAISLDSEMEKHVAFVTDFSIDSVSTHIAYIVQDTSTERNGVYLAALSDPGKGNHLLVTDSSRWASNLTWNNRTGELFFLAGSKDTTEYKLNAALYGASPEEKSARIRLSNDDLDEGWQIYHTNSLDWSLDGERLFLGIKPQDQIIPPEPPKDTVIDLYDREKILKKRGVDVWHWNDPFINSHQKKQWKTEKDRVYLGVFYPEQNDFVQLADQEMPTVYRNESGNYVLGRSQVPYMREATWDGWYYDYYTVDLKSGEQKMFADRLGSSVRMSPDGKYVIYYQKDHWYRYNVEKDITACMTASLEVPFYDEDWDYPAARPGYGTGGWVGESHAAIIYDKFDIWIFPMGENETPHCLTGREGRAGKLQFRIRQHDRKKRFFEKGEELLLSAYHDDLKYQGIYSVKLTKKPTLKERAGGEFRYTTIGKAREDDAWIFTKQSYNLFPDIWVSDARFNRSLQLSDLNPQKEDFLWGEPELIDWLSADGKRIQGIVIKPDNYDPAKRYPVLVYYYRFFTPRMYSFPHMAINHRPNYPYYSGNDYVIFLPDIRFDIGTPGYSATKCLVPGVQKLIDMGIANKDAIGLHGHSWSGYQTSHVITQTDLFACAIAGAPVSNMTSAYGGIRWGSGLSRMFQYEKSQSRIGGTLWEARDKYIENSPLFFADRINTPLLIMFGDEDDAVPWYQGIELYMALRRLDKDCIFLQYRGEPHHPRKYGNKLDYTIRFKEYLDHYLKGEPAAEWIKSGELYRGK